MQRRHSRYSAASTVLLLGLGTVKCEDTRKIYIRIIYTQPPAAAAGWVQQCTAGDEGPVADISCMNIFSHFQGLLTSVQLAATK